MSGRAVIQATVSVWIGCSANKSPAPNAAPAANGRPRSSVRQSQNTAATLPAYSNEFMTCAACTCASPCPKIFSSW